MYVCMSINIFDKRTGSPPARNGKTVFVDIRGPWVPALRSNPPWENGLRGPWVPPLRSDPQRAAGLRGPSGV